MPEAEPLCDILDVEILRSGNWTSGLSGRVPITDDDIAAIIAASTDPEIDEGPVKIGHVDPRFDGEPAIGWLRNLRRRDDGTLLADIKDAPRSMETMIRTAFKRRSAEIAWNVKTPSGKTYKAALTGLALLGVTPPAVKGLADVAARYATLAADSRSSVTVVDGEDGDLAVLHAAALNSTAAYEARRAFLASSGDLIGPPPDPSSNARRTASEASVNDDEVRATLGLPGEIPVTDQIRALAEAQAKQTADAQAAAAAQAQADQDAAAKADADRRAAEEAARVAAEAAKAAGGQPPTVAVDAAAFAELQRQAAEGAAANRILAEQEREQVLASALSGGKILPASVAQYRALYDANPEPTKALLAGLPQVFATVESTSAQPFTHLSGGQPATELDRELDAFQASIKDMGFR